MKFDLKVIVFSVLAGMLVWISDAFLDHFFFSGKNIWDLLMIEVPEHIIFIRILIVLYFFLFGSVIAAYANKHKKSTKELQDFEFKYKTIADKTNAWEFWKNTVGGDKYVSPAFERITGYHVNDLKQNPELIKKIIHPDDLERVTRHLEDEAKNTMEIAELEFKIITQNNEVKKIKHTCQPVYDKNGKFKGTRGSNIEIPEQTIEHSINIAALKQTKNDLNTSEELINVIFDYAPDAFYLHDLKGTIINCNKAAEELSGYKRKELIGKNFLGLKLLNISDAVKAARLLAENALGDPTGPDEFIINRKDGKKVPIEIRSFPVKTSGRTLVFIVALDISERKTAEKNLAHLNQAIETSREVIFMTDVEGIFTYVNPEFTKMYGYTFEEVVGIETPRILKSGTTSKEDYEKFWKAILNKENLSTTYANKRKDGKLMDVEASANPILNDNGDITGFLAIQRDITDRKRAEDELNEKTYELGERVKELNCLYDISHQMANAGSTVENIMRKTIQSILPSFQYPEITCARITLNDGRVFSSPNWKETVSFQSAEIVSGISNLGSIDVGYLEEKPEIDEGLFLKEERNLIDAIGILLGDFIEKKKAEFALIESENKFRTMSNAAQDAIIMMDENGNITYWNKAAEKMFDFSENEIMGMNLHRAIVPGRYFEKFKQGFDHFRKSGGGNAIGKPVELFAINKSGEEFPIELTISPVNIKGKWNSIGIIRDITERKRSEKLQNAVYQISEVSGKAKSLDDLYRSVHEIIGSIMPANNFFISSYDEKNDLLSFDYFVDEIDELDDHEDYAKPSKGFTAYVLRTGKPLFLDEAAETKLLATGEVENVGTKSAIWLGVPLIIENKTIGAMVVQHYSDPNAYSKNDLHLLEYISSQIAKSIVTKRIEEKLQRSEERFRGLYENSTMGIYRSTPKGKIIMANPAALRLLGYASFEELSNIKSEDGYYDPSERKRFLEIMDSDGTVYGFETKWKRADGTVVDLRESARTITDIDGKVIYYEGIFEDISEKKRAEVELIKAKENAEEVSRLKSNFLANMSHELRTPLIGITGFAEILAEELEDKENKEKAETILQSGGRLSETLDLILDLSMLESDKLKISKDKINIIDVIEESIYSSRQVIRMKGLEFNFEINDKAIYCNVDKNLFGRAIHYFLDNSIKYTHEGSISVKVFTNGNATIQITDTGIGIPKDKLIMIFEPFRQASEGYDRKYEGTGLGLTLAKKFIEVLGGTVSVKSEEAKGSVFTIEFPEVK